MTGINSELPNILLLYQQFTQNCGRIEITASINAGKAYLRQERGYYIIEISAHDTKEEQTKSLIHELIHLHPSNQWYLGGMYHWNRENSTINQRINELEATIEYQTHHIYKTDLLTIKALENILDSDAITKQMR